MSSGCLVDVLSDELPDLVLEDRSDVGSNVQLKVHSDVHPERWSLLRLDERILNSDIQCYLTDTV